MLNPNSHYKNVHQIIYGVNQASKQSIDIDYSLSNTLNPNLTLFSLSYSKYLLLKFQISLSNVVSTVIILG